MTRANLIHKWLFYGLGLFPIWLLDCYVLSRYPVLGVTPMLLPLVVVAVATLEGQIAGAGFGMVVGFLWETTYPGGFGLMILLMTLLGMLCGATTQYALSQSFLGFFICAIGVLTVIECFTVGGLLFLQLALPLALLEIAGQQLVLTMMWSPLVYLLFRTIFKKVGGTKLA